ncbi:MAG TPA: hypothetical protein VFW94_04870 [Candidatus Acidoferrales bacterium]|nr:hypothetical protein [Candidatus Acidoferrales bacterium]
MQYELKSISKEGIPEALAKVERYRLLNEPALAESICLDILAIVPDNQQALISLLLVRTDQFQSNLNAKPAQDALARIKGDYERAYYTGIIWERLGHARLRQSAGGAAAAYHALRAAMDHYEKAIQCAPPGNDDAILRWNTCARTIMQNPDIRPSRDEESADVWLRDEAGSRIADA